MGDIRTSANASFRDYVTDAVPASGAHEPVKSEIRATFAVIEDEVNDALLASVAGVRWITQTVRVRSTANVAIATGLVNATVLNGVTLATGDHVFLGSQTAPAENGIYTVVASGAASRASFADTAAELAYIGFWITSGTVGAGGMWTLPLAAASITLGTTSLVFSDLGAPFQLLTTANTWPETQTFTKALLAQTLTVGLGKSTTVATNTVVGVEAGASASLSGASNALFGYTAGQALTTGASNVFAGSEAGVVATTALANTVMGSQAAQGLTTGTYNVALGVNAGNALATSSSNVFVGAEAGYALAAGGTNVAIGNQAMRGNANGSNCIAIGPTSLWSGTAVSNTVAIGADALYALTTGANSTAVGHQAGAATTTGTRLTALGAQALVMNTTGDDNAACGAYCLDGNTTGSRNTGIGINAGYIQKTGNDNFFGGYAAGRGLEPATFAINRTVALGSQALNNPSTGADDNTVVGFKAGHGVTTGAQNTCLGATAGDNITTGSSNIVIGSGQDADSATGSGQVNIGGRYFHDRINLLERSSDPTAPAEGQVVIWMSDGLGKGDDGDVLIAATAGGVTKWATLFDHSAGAAF